MIKKILLPLDGSHSALNFAIHLAKKLGAVSPDIEKGWNVLLNSIKSSHPDLITMGAFEKTAITEFFIGSFTQEKSPVPLFIYH